MNSSSAKSMVDELLSPLKNTKHTPKLAAELNSLFNHLFQRFNQERFRILNAGKHLITIQVEWDSASNRCVPYLTYS